MRINAIVARDPWRLSLTGLIREKALIRTKKLILHIGSWKTGTTSIQSYLSGKYQQLKADKVLYPMTSRRRADGGVDTAHHRLRMLLDGADGAMTLQVAGVLDRMAVELKQAQCETLLLSSETFMDFRRPETLRRYIEADEVQIVAVFRNQAEFISSMYYTEVCHRKVIDLPMDYLDGFNGNLLDYASCLVPWRRAWPEAQSSVSLFERGTPARDFPAAHMMAQIGLNWPRKRLPSCFSMLEWLMTIRRRPIPVCSDSLRRKP